MRLSTTPDRRINVMSNESTNSTSQEQCPMIVRIHQVPKQLQVRSLVQIGQRSNAQTSLVNGSTNSFPRAITNFSMFRSPLKRKFLKYFYSSLIKLTCNNSGPTTLLFRNSSGPTTLGGSDTVTS
jgi:hypothetical protein